MRWYTICTVLLSGFAISYYLQTLWLWKQDDAVLWFPDAAVWNKKILSIHLIHFNLNCNWNLGSDFQEYQITFSKNSFSYKFTVMNQDMMVNRKCQCPHYQKWNPPIRITFWMFQSCTTEGVSWNMESIVKCIGWYFNI